MGSITKRRGDCSGSVGLAVEAGMTGMSGRRLPDCPKDRADPGGLRLYWRARDVREARIPAGPATGGVAAHRRCDPAERQVATTPLDRLPACPDTRQVCPTKG